MGILALQGGEDVKAAIGFVFGTAGFTTIDADRGVAVNVTEDYNAYLGYEQLTNEGENITAGQPTPVVEYHNQIGFDLDTLEVNVLRTSSSGPIIKIADSPSQLDQGGAGTVTVTLDCSTTQDIELKFEVTGTGSSASVSYNRTLEVTCVPSQAESEQGDGEDEDEAESGQEDGEDEAESEQEDGKTKTRSEVTRSLC